MKTVKTQFNLKIAEAVSQSFTHPAAHDPAEVPPLEVHSLDVKQVPLRNPAADPELKVQMKLEYVPP